jgi:hypothetical protein
MKQSNRSITKKIRPVILYLDEIKKIVELIEEQAKLDVIKISGDLHNYETTSSVEIDDFASLQETHFHDVEIRCLQPYISVRLSGSFGEVYVSEDTILSKGLSEKIIEIIRCCERPFAWFTTAVWLPAVTAYLSVIMLLKEFSLSAFAIFACSLIWFYASWTLSFQRYCTLILRSRKANTNFFQRKKDDLYMVVASTIIGGVIGGLITAFLF